MKSHIIGVDIGLSGGTSDNDYNYARSIEKKAFIFGG